MEYSTVFIVSTKCSDYEYYDQREIACFTSEEVANRFLSKCEELFNRYEEADKITTIKLANWRQANPSPTITPKPCPDKNLWSPNNSTQWDNDVIKPWKKQIEKEQALFSEWNRRYSEVRDQIFLEEIAVSASEDAIVENFFLSKDWSPYGTRIYFLTTMPVLDTF